MLSTSTVPSTDLNPFSKSPRSVTNVSGRLFQVRLGTQSFTLQRDLAYIIGSGAQANIEVSDRSIPSRSATIRNDQLSVHEGIVHVNGRVIQPNTQAVTLRDGDVLKLGSTVMSLVELSPEASAIQSQGIASAQQHHPGGIGSTGTAAGVGTGAGLAGAGLAGTGLQHEHPSSQAIKPTSSPSNSTFLKSHVQDKDDGIDRNRYGTTDSGIVGGKSLANVDNVDHRHQQPLASSSSVVGGQSADNLTQMIQPNSTTTLPTGAVLTAGAIPLIVHENKSIGHQPGATVISVRDRDLNSGNDAIARDNNNVVDRNLVVGGVDTTNRDTFDGHNKFSDSDLVQMTRDLVELGNLRLSPAADASLLSTIGLFPSHMRQNMGSTELKHWLRASEKERLDRVNQSRMGTGAGLNQPGISDSMTGAGTGSSRLYSSTDPNLHHQDNTDQSRFYASNDPNIQSHSRATDPLGHSDSIGTSSTNDPTLHQRNAINSSWDDITEPDLAYGMLALVGHSSGHQGPIAESMGRGAGIGGSSSGIGHRRWESSDLSTIFNDYADMHGEQLDPSVRSRIPQMLDRLPQSTRQSLGVAELKSWIQHAHHNRVSHQPSFGAMNQTTAPMSTSSTSGGMPVSTGMTGGESGIIHSNKSSGILGSGAGSNNLHSNKPHSSLTEMDLIRSLIGMKWHNNGNGQSNWNNNSSNINNNSNLNNTNTVRAI